MVPRLPHVASPRSTYLLLPPQHRRSVATGIARRHLHGHRRGGTHSLPSAPTPWATAACGCVGYAWRVVAYDSPGDGVRSAVSPIGIPPRLRCFSRAVPSVVLFEEVEFYRVSHEALVRATSLQLEAPVWGKVVVRPGCPLVCLRSAGVTPRLRCLRRAVPSVLLFACEPPCVSYAAFVRAMPFS